jgi:hypothetical protein
MSRGELYFNSRYRCRIRSLTGRDELRLIRVWSDLASAQRDVLPSGPPESTKTEGFFTEGNEGNEEGRRKFQSRGLPVEAPSLASLRVFCLCDLSLLCK